MDSATCGPKRGPKKGTEVGTEDGTEAGTEVGTEEEIGHYRPNCPKCCGYDCAKVNFKKNLIFDHYFGNSGLPS